jgi:hypothetical protein
MIQSQKNNLLAQWQPTTGQGRNPLLQRPPGTACSFYELYHISRL